MSTFYLLPPRAVLGDCLASFLHEYFPGLDWDAPRRAELAEALGGAAAAHPDVYVVYRDDLPAGELSERALADGFGARAGDEVVEVRPTGGAGGLSARRWRLG